MLLFHTVKTDNWVHKLVQPPSFSNHSNRLIFAIFSPTPRGGGLSLPDQLQPAGKQVLQETRWEIILIFTSKNFEKRKCAPQERTGADTNFLKLNFEI